MLSTKPNGSPSSSQSNQNEESQDSTIARSDKLPANVPSSETSRVSDGKPITDGKSTTNVDTAVDGKLRKRFPKIPYFGKKENNEKDEIARSRTPQSHNPKPKFTVMGQLRATIFNSWLNVLFIFIPIGIAMQFANVSPVVVFATNFIAIIPLAAMLSYATEEIAIRTGETIGGLLNATFG